jgi:hypothetical protein
MIIKGGARNNATFYVKHLQRVDTNERVHIAETRGFAVEGDVEAAFQDMMGIASGTKCKNSFYVVSINPDEDERLTPAQWQEAVDRVEHRLGLDGQARIVIEHEKFDRIHRHVVWSRIDLDTMGVISDSFNYQKHEQASREIEEAFGLRHVDSVLTKDRDGERPERRPADWESFRAADTKIDPHRMKAEITALWQEADSGLAFKSALEDAGFILAKGDRRDFVLIDSAADDHSLAKRISGAKAADIRARLSDVDRDSLPSVAEAREQARAAADSADAAAPQEAPILPRAQPADADTDSATARAAQRAGAVFDVTADITPEVDNYLAQRFGDRTETPAATQAAPEKPAAQEPAPNESPDDRQEAPRQTLDDREQAPRTTMREREDAPRGTPDEWRTKQPGEGGDRREEFTAWERLAARMRSYAERARELFNDETSGGPDDERGPWQRFIGAAKHVVRGWTRRDIDELAEGVREGIELIADDPAGGHSPPAEPRREPPRPDAQVDASEPDDRPQPETPTVTEPLTDFGRMAAFYFADTEAGDAEAWPEAEPMDNARPEPEPEPPDHDAPDMD